MTISRPNWRLSETEVTFTASTFRKLKNPPPLNQANSLLMMKPVQEQWKCEEVTVWAPLSSNKITETVITEKWDNNREQKLVNEFNAANLGMIGGAKSSEEAKAKIEAYKAYLSERATLKAQVDADCLEYGIL